MLHDDFSSGQLKVRQASEVFKKITFDDDTLLKFHHLELKDPSGSIA